jgi:hypothetical protein
LAGIDAKEDPKVKRVRDKRTALLKEKLTEEQVARYDVYRSAGFSKTMVKRTMQAAGASAALAETCVIVLSGITKVFVGEVVELGERDGLARVCPALTCAAFPSNNSTFNRRGVGRQRCAAAETRARGLSPTACSGRTPLRACAAAHASPAAVLS